MLYHIMENPKEKYMCNIVLLLLLLFRTGTKGFTCHETVATYEGLFGEGDARVLRT